MNVLVVGAGSVGRMLIRRLREIGHDVSVLLESPAEASLLERDMNVNTSGVVVLGEARDIDDLRKAGIEHVDALVAVTTDDNSNLMVAQIAADVFRVPHVLCTVEDRGRRLVLPEDSSIRVVCPTSISADALLSTLLSSTDAGRITLGNASLGCHLVRPSRRALGKPLSRFACPSDMLVLGVLHANGSFALAGTDKEPLVEGDQVALCSIVL